MRQVAFVFQRAAEPVAISGVAGIKLHGERKVGQRSVQIRLLIFEDAPPGASEHIVGTRSKRCVIRGEGLRQTKLLAAENGDIVVDMRRLDRIVSLLQSGRILAIASSRRFWRCNIEPRL